MAGITRCFHETNASASDANALQTCVNSPETQTVTVLLIIVTAPVRAMARPQVIDAESSMLMLACATMVPWNTEDAPSDAELPTAQKPGWDRRR